MMGDATYCCNHFAVVARIRSKGKYYCCQQCIRKKPCRCSRYWYEVETTDYLEAAAGRVEHKNRTPTVDEYAEGVGVYND